MMSASPNAEHSFELMGEQETNEHVDTSKEVDEKIKKSSDFNFTSLWRKPRLSRRLLRPSTEKANYHVQLDSPQSQDISYATPAKKSTTKARRNVKDRESFETMGSPHLSELDESRDVVPVIMKREGWDFGRENPDGCDKSTSTSSTKKREMNPRMFLTPTPTKTKPLRRSLKDTPSESLKQNVETDNVFAVVRSGGLSNKKTKRPHPWEEPSQSKQEPVLAAAAPQTSDCAEISEAATIKSENSVEDVEVYRGDYLMSDAYLSSISEDSGDGDSSYLKQQRRVSKDPFNNSFECSERAESKAEPVAAGGNSFKDRLKMFQSKEQTRQQTVPIKRNEKLSQAAPEVNSIPVIPTNDSNIEDTKPVEEATGEKENGEHQETKEPKNTVESLAEGNVTKLKTAAYKPMSLTSPRKDSFARTRTGSGSSNVEKATVRSNGAGNSQPERENSFVHTSASRFGVTLGARRKALRTRTSAETTTEPTEEPIETKSPIELKKNVLGKSLSPEKKNNIPSKEAQPVSDKLSSTNKSTVNGDNALTLASRKQSKSTSVLERSKMFERSKNTSKVVPQPHGNLHARKSNIASSCTTVTCDKCGSSVKAPKREASSEAGHEPEIKSVELLHRLSEASNVETKVVIEEEVEAYSDPEDDIDDSDDESTVVGSRRDTLKSAPRNIARVVNVPAMVPTNLFGTTKLEGPKQESTRTAAVKNCDVKKEANKKVSTVSERMKMFEKPNAKLPSSPNRVMGSRTLKKQNTVTTSKEANEMNSSNNDTRDKKKNIEKDDHPSVVDVEDDFTLRDDTSGFYSVSVKSDHRIVAQPSDSTPYYLKKLRKKAEFQIQSLVAPRISLEIHKTETSRRSSCKSMSNFSLKGTQSRPNATTSNNIVRPSVATKEKHEKSSVSGMQSTVFAERQKKSACSSRPHASSSISTKLAMFEKKPQRKWSTSKAVPVQRNSVDRTSLSSRRKSRKSSLSLQDVLDSRNDEENQKMSVQGMHSIDLDTNVELNANVRPSHLLKKLKENVAPAPPSPLVGRRGFSSAAMQPSSSRSSSNANLRCF